MYNLNGCFCLTEKMVIDIVPSSVLSTDRPETYRSQAVPVYLRGKKSYTCISIKL